MLQTSQCLFICEIVRTLDKTGSKRTVCKVLVQKLLDIMTPNLRDMFRRLKAFKWYHFCENAKASEKSVPWIVLRFDAGLLADRVLIILVVR